MTNVSSIFDNRKYTIKMRTAESTPIECSITITGLDNCLELFDRIPKCNTIENISFTHISMVDSNTGEVLKSIDIKISSDNLAFETRTYDCVARHMDEVLDCEGDI